MLNDVILYNEEIASKCIFGSEFVRDLLFGENINFIYQKENHFNMSSKKVEGFKKIAKYRNYYQQNPVKFIKDFFNIQLLDSQAYLMTEAWTKGHFLCVGSRAYGKSFWIVLFCMAKQMLSCEPWNCYIASGSSQQSATTFKKLEDIANDRIGSLLNSSGKIFKDEVVIKNAAGDGFSHNPSGFEYEIYNGSFTKTLNSNVDKNRGARSSCVCFDETGWLPESLIQVYQAFCAVDKDFKTGVDENGNAIDFVRLYSLPKEIPNQLIYVSSASSVDTEFYRMYREFSKKMIAGDPDYFVADINCDLVMKPTIGNKPIKSALTKNMIDAAMKTNPSKARREFFNEFDTDLGENAIIRRGIITRNEEVRKPVLENETGQSKYIIAYDPARSRDNSVISVMEVYDSKLPNGETEKKGKIVACYNLLEVGKKIKSPMQTPDQVKFLKQLILDYNAGADAYENILGIYIDAGSGGGGVNIADYLMEDWETVDGIKHRGLIDKEYSSDYLKKFPNAVDKVKLIAPAAWKSTMFEEAIELTNQDKISFTAQYDNKGYINIFRADEKEMQRAKTKVESKLKKKNLSPEEYEKRFEEEIDKEINLDSIVVKLDWKEEIALMNIDAMKEELINIVRKERDSGKDSFELAPEKASRLHDDRAYTYVLLSHGLMTERRKNLLNKKRKPASNLKDYISIRPPKLRRF